MSSIQHNATRKKWTTGFLIKKTQSALRDEKGKCKVRKGNKKIILTYFSAELTLTACIMLGKYFMNTLILNKEENQEDEKSQKKSKK